MTMREKIRKFNDRWRQSALSIIVATLVIVVLAVRYIPRLQPENFLLAATVYLVAYLGGALVVAWDSHLASPMSYLDIYGKWIAIGMVVFTFLRVAPIPFETLSRSIQPGQTYMTYSDDCPYCEISKTNSLMALKLYNHVHNGNIKLVNIDGHSELAKELRNYVKTKGTIIRFVNVDKYGSKQLVYTLSDTSGNPVEASPDHVYKMFEEIKK